MSYRLSRFAGLGGLEIRRDGEFQVTGKLSTPLDALLVPVTGARYVAQANANPRVAAVVTTAELAAGFDARLAVGVAPAPSEVHSEIHARCVREHENALQARATQIDPTAAIDPTASIATYGVVIGPQVRVGPRAVVLPSVTLEEGCVLHPGVVIGMPGFEVNKVDGRQTIIPQLGGVRVCRFAQLLPNVCVARALFGGETIIGEEAMIDSHSYVAHDCRIGRAVQICANVSVMGRVVLGDGVYIGPGAVIRNGLRVGDGATVSMGAVVTQDVPARVTVTGNFAIDHERFLDHVRAIR
jgi:UDP-3-O-[3-hydroxymyristoyl] glucosamine N-acyltransferase